VGRQDRRLAGARHLSLLSGSTPTKLITCALSARTASLEADFRICGALRWRRPRPLALASTPARPAPALYFSASNSSSTPARGLHCGNRQPRRGRGPAPSDPIPLRSPIPPRPSPADHDDARRARRPRASSARGSTRREGSRSRPPATPRAPARDQGRRSSPDAAPDLGPRRIPASREP
jgi:hypothetical protein